MNNNQLYLILHNTANKFRILITRNIFTILAVFYIFCFIIPFFFITKDLSLGAKFGSFPVLAIVFALILLVPALILNKPLKSIYLIILFIAVAIPTLLNLCYILIFRCTIDLDMYFTFIGTENTEIGFFISNYINAWIFLFVILYVVVSIFLIAKSVKTHYPSKTRFPGILISGSLFFAFVLICIPNINERFYVSKFYDSIIQVEKQLKTYNKTKKSRLKIDKIDFKQSRINSKEEVYVIIIGESVSRHHMSIYNYPRQTNPLLTQIKDSLFIFNDVVAGATTTAKSLFYALSFADPYNESFYERKPSMIDMLNQLNYKTYWIKNQTLKGVFDYTYGIIAESSREILNIKTGLPDEKLLPFLETALSETASKKFIFIHLAGSHFPYANKFPSSFNKFTNTNDPFLAKNKFSDQNGRKTINEYDNSLCYNDKIVYSIISQIKKQDKYGFVIYFSDHGEDVFDTGKSSGRFQTRYTSDIPFLAFFTNKFVDRNQDRINSVRQNLNKPYSLIDLIYGITDLLSIEYDYSDNTRSIFSPTYIPRNRIVNNKDYKNFTDERE